MYGVACVSEWVSGCVWVWCFTSPNKLHTDRSLFGYFATFSSVTLSVCECVCTCFFVNEIRFQKHTHINAGRNGKLDIFFSCKSSANNRKKQLFYERILNCMKMNDVANKEMNHQRSLKRFFPSWNGCVIFFSFWSE